MIFNSNCIVKQIIVELFLSIIFFYTPVCMFLTDEIRVLEMLVRGSLGGRVPAPRNSVLPRLKHCRTV